MPIPIGGPLAIPFKMFGVTRSKMNPNICTICERAFRKVKKSRQISIDASILFADIRGYTALAERSDVVALGEIVSAFQDECARGIWALDGIVNKQMGDGLMAIFNFPIKAERHAEAAVRAGIEIQRRCKAALEGLRSGPDLAAAELGVGVGVHTGQVEIGEFSTAHSDYTAIGSAVNLAARLEAQAAAGEVLISLETAARATELTEGMPRRQLELKGIDRPVEAIVIAAA